MKSNIEISSKTINTLRRFASLAEQQRFLHKEQLKIIYREKWLKIFVPKELGGLQLDLPSALLLEEKLAWIDGSLGWTVTLCAGANLFVGYIAQHKSKKIFSKNNVCLGGSGAVSGTAAETENGFLINGSWKYATGSTHLTHFTANCRILRNNKPVLDESGEQVIRSFYFEKKDVTLYKDWNAMGLKATASNSFSVKDLPVKSDQSFNIDPKHAVINHPFYQYPFLQFAELTIAINTLGMTQHFFEEALDIIESRRNNQKISLREHKLSASYIRKSKVEIDRLRTRLYFLVDKAWAELSKTGKIKQTRLNLQSSLSKLLVKACREHVVAVYPICGLAAAEKNTVINRIFRDIFTASQHSLLTL